MRVAAVFLALLCCSGLAAAQSTDLDRAIEVLLRQRYETVAGIAGAESTRVDYGAYVTFSLLGRDDLNGTTRQQQQLDARLWARFATGGHELYGRLRFRYRDWNTGDSFNGNDSYLVSPIGDRYWYKFDWRAHKRATQGVDPDWGWSAQVGRQYIYWASGIVWSQPTYALRLGADNAQWTFDAFLGQTVRDMVDVDPSRPGFQDDTTRNVWAVRVEHKGTFHRPYVYILSQTDENDAMVGAVRWFYDSSYAAVGSVGQFTGTLLYRTELIYEWGETASDLNGVLPQTLDDISAWGGRFQLSYIVRSARTKSRLRFEFELLVGTGDDDRMNSNATAGGNLSGTNDNAFNAFGIARTGLVLQPEITNLTSLRFSGSAFPLHGRGVFDRFFVLVEAFVFLKTDPDAPISVPTIPGTTYLGFEVDVILEWQVFSDLSFDLRYGVFFPDGDAFGDSNPRHFAYFGASYAF